MSIQTSKSFLTKIASALLTIGSVVLSLPQASIAQPQGQRNSQPLQDLFPTKETTDPFSNRGDGTALFDLLHRAMQGTGRNLEDFETEQRKNLNDAAAQFRERQRQLIKKQQETQSSDGVSMPSGDIKLTPQ